MEQDIIKVNEICAKYNIKQNERTPFGLITHIAEKEGSINDILSLQYNIYFSKSLLLNSNKWIIKTESENIFR